MWRSRVIPVEHVSRGVKGTPVRRQAAAEPRTAEGLLPAHGAWRRPPWLRTSSPGFCHQAGRLPLGRPATRNGFGGTFRDKGPHGPSASSPEPVRESSPGCRRCCFGGLGVSVLLVAGAAGLTDGSRRAEACPRASFGGCCLCSRGAWRGNGHERPLLVHHRSDGSRCPSQTGTAVAPARKALGLLGRCRALGRSTRLPMSHCWRPEFKWQIQKMCLLVVSDGDFPRGRGM